MAAQRDPAQPVIINPNRDELNPEHDNDFANTFVDNREFIFDKNEHSAVGDILEKGDFGKLKHIRARLHNHSGTVLSNRNSKTKLRKIKSTDKAQVIKDILYYGPLSYVSTGTGGVAITGVSIGTLTPPPPKRAKRRLRETPVSPFRPLIFNPSIESWRPQIPGTPTDATPSVAAPSGLPEAAAGAPPSTSPDVALTVVPEPRPPPGLPGVAGTQLDTTSQVPASGSPSGSPPIPIEPIIPSSDNTAPGEEFSPSWANDVAELIKNGKSDEATREINRFAGIHNSLTTKYNELLLMVNELNDDRCHIKERLNTLEELVGANLEEQHKIWGQLTGPKALATMKQAQTSPTVTTAATAVAAAGTAQLAEQPVISNQVTTMQLSPTVTAATPQATSTTQTPAASNQISATQQGPNPQKGSATQQSPSPQQGPSPQLGPSPQQGPATQQGVISATRSTSNNVDLYIANIDNKHDRKFIQNHINSRTDANLKLKDIIQVKKGNDGKTFKVTVPAVKREAVQIIWDPSIIAELWRKKTFQGPPAQSTNSRGPRPHVQVGQAAGPRPHRQGGQPQPEHNKNYQEPIRREFQQQYNRDYQRHPDDRNFQHHPDNRDYQRQPVDRGYQRYPADRNFQSHPDDRSYQRQPVDWDYQRHLDDRDYQRYLDDRDYQRQRPDLYQRDYQPQRNYRN